MKNIGLDELRELSKLEGRKIIVGGAALLLYGCSIRGTKDIDIEVEAGDLVSLNIAVQRIKDAGIPCDVTGDVSGWGLIPLPLGFRDRIVKTDLPNIYILEPVDYVLSKLRRGTNIDEQDALSVMQAQGLNADAVRQRAMLIELPLDPVSFRFSQRLEMFCRSCDAVSTSACGM